MATADNVMSLLGLLCALWCVGLVTWVVHADGVQRATMMKIMNMSLESILMRVGELNRQRRYEADRHS